MGRLWEAVRSNLAPEDDRALGRVYVGQKEYPHGWAHTNFGEDRVNLTLELHRDELQLNLVGWKQDQSDALKDWLQTVAGEDAVNSLNGYEVVAYKRIAYKKAPGSRPWWQDPEVVELGVCVARDFTAGWVTRQMTSMGRWKDEKPAFHIRHRWSRAEAEALGSRLPAEVAAEIRRLMPLLRSIWQRADR